MDENRENTAGKLFNFSQAERVGNIAVDRAVMKRYDERRASFIRKYRKWLGVFLLLLSLSLKLFIGGSWFWGAVVLLLSLGAFFLFFIHFNGAKTTVYSSGLLIPAIVSKTNLIELVALSDVSATESNNEHLAYKHFSVNNLPLHKLEKGERVPCVALFGGERDGLWTAYEPRPLTWATADMEAIKKNIARIEEREWTILESIYENTHVDNDEIVLLNVDNSTGEVSVAFSSCSYHGVEFTYPDSWTLEVEELDNNSYYVCCEEKGNSSEGLITIVSLEDVEELDERLNESIDSFKSQLKYTDLEQSEVMSVQFCGYDALCTRLKMKIEGQTVYDYFYAFHAEEKTITICMQDNADIFDDKFSFFTNSFVITPSIQA